MSTVVIVTRGFLAHGLRPQGSTSPEELRRRLVEGAVEDVRVSPAEGTEAPARAPAPSWVAAGAACVRLPRAFSFMRLRSGMDVTPCARTSKAWPIVSEWFSCGFGHPDHLSCSELHDSNFICLFATAHKMSRAPDFLREN